MELPMPTELRHVYRALLRAATYLPDSASRTYAHDRIIQRFRTVSDKIKSKSFFERQALIARYHGREHIQKTRQQARQLERAGLGSTPDLQKILLATYGRTGSRRRELIRKLMVPEEDVSSDTESVERLIAKQLDGGVGNASITKAQQLPPAASKVGSFLQSHIAASPNVPWMNIRAIRHLEPAIPKENEWGRPLPLKLQASLKRKHWKKILSNILPPLPTYEWMRLRDLAVGALPIEDPPLRRPKPVVVENLDDLQITERLLYYFTTPVDQQRMRGRDTDEITVGEEGATYHSRPRATAVVPRRAQPKHSVRHMRRLYAGVWQATPMMSQDEVTKVWTTKWGTGRSAFLSGNITAPESKDFELFEGAEAAQTTTKQPKRFRSVRKESKEQIATGSSGRLPENLQVQEVRYSQGVKAAT